MQKTNTATSKNEWSVKGALAEMQKREQETINELLSKKKLLGPTVKSVMHNGINKKMWKEWRKITAQVLIEMNNPKRSKAQQEEHQAKKAARAARRKEKRQAAKAA